MRKLTLFCLIICLFKISSVAQQIKNYEGKTYVYKQNHWFDDKGYQLNDSVVTIRFKTKESASKALKNYRILRSSPSGYIDVKVPSNYDLFSFAKILKQLRDIEIVEFNTIGFYKKIGDKYKYLYKNNYTPNDTHLTNQWYLNRINIFNAWDIVKGNSCITVAIIDSGVDWSHEDLGMGSDGFQNIALNGGEDVWSNVNSPSTGNSIDDDSNGYVDDWKGWNFANNSNDTRTTNRHGTLVAGIVGAKTGNSTGIAGVAGGSNSLGTKLLPLCIGVSAPDGSV